jgi:hypothetical protein
MVFRLAKTKQISTHSNLYASGVGRESRQIYPRLLKPFTSAGMPTAIGVSAPWAFRYDLKRLRKEKDNESV